MERLRTDLDRQEGMEYRFGRPSYFSFRTPIEVEIRGYNLNLLERLADALATRMRGIEGLADIRSSSGGRNPRAADPFRSRASGDLRPDHRPRGRGGAHQGAGDGGDRHTA